MQENQLSDKVIKSLMPAVDIDSFHTAADRILIHHPEHNQLDAVTEGGIILTDKSIEKKKMEMMTSGIVIKVGPKVENKSIKEGTTVFFFRAMSEGAIKGLDDTVYVLFSEYHILGWLDKNAVIKTVAPKQVMAEA